MAIFYKKNNNPGQKPGLLCYVFFFYFINELYAFINYSKIMYTIKKLIIYLSSLISIVGCIGCGGGGGDSINDTPVSIEFNGDSLMYGPTLELNIPKYTKSTNPKWIVDDRGVGGLTMKSLDIGYKEPYINANPINNTAICNRWRI